MTDYDMVVAIKNGNEKMIENLYNRYVPYLYKKAWMLHRRFNFTEDDVEDFIQDGYFAVIKAIKYINLDVLSNNKTIDTSKWKFYMVLHFYVKTMVNEYLSKDRFSIFEVQETKGQPPHLKMINDYKVMQSMNLVDIDDYINNIEVSKIHTRNAVDRDTKIDMDIFENNLNSYKKTVFQLRRKGCTCEEIGLRVGKSVQRVDQIDKKLKKELKEYLEAT